MFYWPTDLPRTPLIDGYDEQLRDSRLVSTVDAGYNKIRNRYTAVPIDVSESWIFTKTQLLSFINFHKETLGFGSEEFMKIYPQEDIERRYRFTSVPKIVPQGLHFKVTFTAEIMPEVSVL